MHVSYICEIIGVIAFSLVAVLVGFEYELDVFGIYVISICSALGGGVIRDLVLGSIPPTMFVRYSYVVAVLVTVTITLILAKIFDKKIGIKSLKLIKRLINLFDALGLGFFTVVACQKAIDMGYDDNLLLVVFVGTCTAVGGGIIRDVLSGRKPVVLRKDVYAIIAVVASILYFVLNKYTQLTVVWNTYLVALGILITRIIAFRYHLNLEFHIDNEELKKDE